MTDLERCLAILSYLSPHSRVQADELARDLGVSEEQVEEDLQRLADLPIGLERIDLGCRVSQPGYRRILSLVQAGCRP